MKGYFEIDALGSEHVPLLGSSRKSVLSKIGSFRVGQNGPVWVPTYHAIVSVRDLGLASLRDALVSTWPVPGQVHVTALEREVDVTDNLDQIVGYANKHRCEIRLGHVREPWPMSWQAALYSWLHKHRSAWEFLRFTVGEKRQLSSSPMIDVDTVLDDVVEPFPVMFDFTAFPMSY